MSWGVTKPNIASTPMAPRIPRLLGSLLESRLVEGQQHANLGRHLLNTINSMCNERVGVG
eukprot:8115154-Pyramimonas_sp.AAC.2